MNYDIKPAERKDLGELSRLVNSAYRGESSRKGWTTEADFLDGQRTDEESLAQQHENSRNTFLCLREKPEGPILGCVFLEMFQDERGKGCYLGMLTVHPDMQDRRLGRLLMEESESFAKAKGALRMTLGVIQLRDTLIQWYERRGYKKTGETKPFPYGNERAGLPRRDDLHFIMFEKPLA
jgi:ribosomal protein S18 acetylase RimI-like enzyme